MRSTYIIKFIHTTNHRFLYNLLFLVYILPYINFILSIMKIYWARYRSNKNKGANFAILRIPTMHCWMNFNYQRKHQSTSSQ